MENAIQFQINNLLINFDFMQSKLHTITSKVAKQMFDN